MDKNVLRNEEDRLLFTFKNAATNATRNCETADLCGRITTELKSKELRTHRGKDTFCSDDAGEHSTGGVDVTTAFCSL
jgi:hypothetical protein